MLRLWLLLLVLLPNISLLADRIAVHDEQRLALIFLTGLSFVFLYKHPHNPQPITLYLAIILLGLVSSITALAPAYATLEWALFVCLVGLLPLLASKATTEEIIRHQILPAIVLTVLLYGLISLMTLFIAWDYEGQPFWPALIHRFGNIRFFNQFQSWIIPLLPAVLFSSLAFTRRPLLKVLIFSYFALFFALLFYSGGRGSMFAIAAATVLVLLLFGRAGLRWTITMTSCSLVGLILSYQLFTATTMNSILGRVSIAEMGKGTEIALSGRGELWRHSIELISHNPVLGIGPMGYAAVGEQFAHPHSFPLQFAAEWGLPAALLLFLALSYAMLKWLHFAFLRVRSLGCPKWEQAYIISLSASMLSAATHSLVSGIVVMPVSQLMLVLIPAFALGWYRKYHPLKPRNTRVNTSQLWRGLTIAAAIWLFGFTTYELTHYKQHYQIAELANMSFQPRFWLHGNLSLHLQAD